MIEELVALIKLVVFYSGKHPLLVTIEYFWTVFQHLDRVIIYEPLYFCNEWLLYPIMSRQN